ncbi:hypothetical protein P7C71_g2470, partial [Lecanoromycetidae sp. Uapishka_2]
MAGFNTIPALHDFDDQSVYEHCEEAMLEAETRNFVIEFDSTEARAAINVEDDDMKRLLDIKRLAKLYNFSPRLTGIMCSKHNTPNSVPQKAPAHGFRARANKAYNQIIEQRRSIETQSSDLESDEKAGPRQTRSPMLDLNHYKVVNQVWHYCSVDWGSNYLCIGYNSLSDIRITPDNGSRVKRNASHIEKDDDHDADTSESDNNPKGVRNWTWLVLCDDGTVISVYENPFPDHQGPLDNNRKDRLERIRRNLLNVFMQLSKVNDKHRRENPIHTLDIRPGLESNQTSNITIADSPGLLFYYLFDDWYTSYALVSKEEHQYAKLLETLRQDMFEKPHLELIQRLHQYGRQLSVLKRMYQSYALIIQRILDRQKPVIKASGEAATPGSHRTGQTPRDSTNTAHLTDSSAPAGETFGAPLSAAATVRFERLHDRVTYYAISEIQECLDEKEALVFLNFNLITLKESQAVERLTRITILLAKVTILFMPVSLMTAYFSTQLTDLANIYTIKTYWICFGVIMALSFVFLLIFGALSGTLEGKPIYKSFTQTVLDKGKKRYRAMKGK